MKFISKNVSLDILNKKSSRRLESIKAAHKSEKPDSSRVEDYLEVKAELVDMKGYATTLEYEKYHGINLTKKGNQIAEAIRQKHSIILEFFEILGIGRDIANQDAEGIEHHLNPKTIKQLRKFVTFLKSNPKFTEGFNDF